MPWTLAQYLKYRRIWLYKSKVGVSPSFRKCRLWLSEWLLFSFSENSNDATTTPVKHENNEDADSDFLSEDENKVDVKNEQGDVDVKTDPNVKLEGEEYSGRRKSETLDEFKQRWILAFLTVL